MIVWERMIHDSASANMIAAETETFYIRKFPALKHNTMKKKKIIIRKRVTQDCEQPYELLDRKKKKATCSSRLTA